MAKKEVKKAANAVEKKGIKINDSKTITSVVVPENILFKLLS